VECVSAFGDADVEAVGVDHARRRRGHWTVVRVVATAALTSHGGAVGLERAAVEVDDGFTDRAARDRAQFVARVPPSRLSVPVLVVLPARLEPSRMVPAVRPVSNNPVPESVITLAPLLSPSE
jgi:hypothetical protein